MNIKLTLYLLCFLSSSLFSSCIEQGISLSAYAYDPRTKRVLYNIDGHKYLNPLSTLKLMTAATSLALLGEQTKFYTTLEYDGYITKEGVLEGNLYLRGGGDPTLGSNRIDSCLDWQEQIRLWKEVITKEGIKAIKGTLIADATLWERESPPAGWLVEDVANYYGASASALSFHENSYTLFFSPHSEVGKETTLVRTDPPMTHFLIKNEVLTGPPGSGDQACVYYGGEGALAQHVQGTIPALVSEFRIKGAIPNPPFFCKQQLEKELLASGISIEKESLSKKERKTLHITSSPPLKKILGVMHLTSHNLYAEHLVKKLGQEQKREGSTRAGLEVMQEFWKGQGIDLSGCFFADGSGVSMKNQMSPKQLVDILSKAYESSFFPSLLSSLPQKRARVFAKSGSSSQGRSLAGYLQVGQEGTKDELICFAIFINHCPDRKLAQATLEKTLSYIISAASAASSERSVLSKNK